jgi:hypothetical protein
MKFNGDLEGILQRVTFIDVCQKKIPDDSLKINNDSEKFRTSKSYKGSTTDFNKLCQ